MKKTRAFGGLLMLAGLAGASAGTAGIAHASGSAPPGNNGTIKIDGVPLLNVGLSDNHPNHPHVTCTLALSFFGFDAGTDTATVDFTAQSPSGRGPVAVTEGPTNFTFTGFGAGGTLDVSKAYQLDVSGLKANQQQGYHIKVTADVSGSIGADEKYKVFWYQPCTHAAGTTTTTAAPTTTTTTKLGAGHSTTTTTVVKTSPTTTKLGAGHSTTTTTAPPMTTTTRPVTSHPGQEVALGASSSAAVPQASSSAVVPQASSSAAVPQASSSAVVPQVSSSGALPTGAGTDLGFFSPVSSRSSGADWSLLLAGGLTLSATGALIRRRHRKG